MIKTTLAPNAPWYTAEEIVWPEEDKPQEKKVVKKPFEKRTKRAKPSEIDARFEQWLKSIERIK
jgi:hypothetical protein